MGTFPRMSEQTPGKIPGDIVVTLKQKPHDRFERTGDDLRTSLTITLKEALLGFKRTIAHLDDHTVVLSRSEPTMPSTVQQIVGRACRCTTRPARRATCTSRSTSRSRSRSARLRRKPWRRYSTLERRDRVETV